MIISIRRLPHHDGLPLPACRTAGAAGYDVCSAEAEQLRSGMRGDVRHVG